VKEIDFLPDWYKEGKRRRMRTRWQCIALSVLFLLMVAYNTISARRIAAATAALSLLDEQRMQAETVMHEFDALDKQLAEYQTEVQSLQRMDSRIEPAAVLAEISHVIGRHIALRRVEFIAEPVAAETGATVHNGTTVRAAATAHRSGKTQPLGDVRFRILLVGVAASPENVGELVCQLEASSFFCNVHPSGFRNASIEVPGGPPHSPADAKTKKVGTPSNETLQVSEFEITCYLANYEEIENQ